MIDQTMTPETIEKVRKGLVWFRDVANLSENSKQHCIDLLALLPAPPKPEPGPYKAVEYSDPDAAWGFVLDAESNCIARCVPDESTARLLASAWGSVELLRGILEALIEREKYGHAKDMLIGQIKTHLATLEVTP